MKRGVQIYIEGQRLDLFDDEKILINLTVQNLADISKSFTDFTQSFTIPASDRNNRIMQHFYENAVDATLDYGIRRSANIELDLAPFREGLMALEKSNLKNGKVESYTITFYGKLLSFKDLIKDDKLKVLNFNEYGFEYSGEAILDRIIDDVTDYDIRFPLISADRYWSYGDGNNTDITTVAGAIDYSELFPSISISKIITLIGTQYDIDFVGNFMNDERFVNCHLLLRNGDGFRVYTENITVDITNTEDEIIDNFSSLSLDWFDHTNNTVLSAIPPMVVTGASGTTDISTISRISISLTPSELLATYYIEVYEDGNLISTLSFMGAISSQVLYERTVPAGDNTAFSNYKDISFKIKSTTVMTAAYNIQNETVQTAYFTNVGSYTGTAQIIMTGGSVSMSLSTTFDVNNYIPDMTINDFLTGVGKMFNLVFYPLTVLDSNATLTMLLEPLDDWYNRGAVIDVTKHIDVTDIQISQPQLYKEINFEFEKSDSLINQTYFEQFNANYGNFLYKYLYDGGTFNIKVPFENLLQTKFSETELQVGYLLNKSYQSYVNKPILLYKYPKQVCEFKFDVGATTEDVVEYIPFGQDLLYNGENLTLNFNSENSSLLLIPIFNTTFSNYYGQHLLNLYDNKQRLSTVKGVFPISLLTNLQLNDRLIIRDKRYIINSIQLELTSGDVTLELLNDLRALSPFQTNRIGRDAQTINIPFNLPNGVVSIEITDIPSGVSVTPTTFTEDTIVAVTVPAYSFDARITEDEDTRITEDGDTRITENAFVNVITLTVVSTLLTGTTTTTTQIVQL